MNATENKQRIGAELAFFSRMTTSVTHELVNVYAIIRELAGLMQDLLPDGVETSSVDTGKFKTLAQKIEAQSERGECITKRLNRFAHSTDEPLSTVNLTALLQDLTALSKRFADLRKVDIQMTLPGRTVEIACNPFLLQLAIFQSISKALQQPEGAGCIEISMLEEKGRTGIVIQRRGTNGSESGWLDAGLMKDLLDGTNMTLLCQVEASGVMRDIISIGPVPRG